MKTERRNLPIRSTKVKMWTPSILLALGIFSLLGCKVLGDKPPVVLPSPEPETSEPQQDFTYLDDEGNVVTAPDPTWPQIADIIAAKCTVCHSTGNLSTYRPLETGEHVINSAQRIYVRINADDAEKGPMPPSAHYHNPDCAPTPQRSLYDTNLTDYQKQAISFFYETGLLQQIDSTAVLSPPASQVLGGSSVTTNDRSATPFEVVSDEIELRDLDEKMQDVYYCVAIRPETVNGTHITGMQINPDVGYIFKGAEVYLDLDNATAGMSDVYPCSKGDPGFEADPLVRFFPHRKLVETPGGYGFEYPQPRDVPTRIVYLVHVHTHHDEIDYFEEYLNGVDDAGDSITDPFQDRNGDGKMDMLKWHDNTTLTLRWESQSVISLVKVEIPDGVGIATVPEQSIIFSSAVGTGDQGDTYSLTHTDSGECVQGHSDVDAVWNGERFFDIFERPVLDAGDMLELECTHSGGADQKCEAVVYLAPTVP